MAIDIAPAACLTHGQLVALAELLQAARRQAFDEYRTDRDHARQVDAVETGDAADRAEVELERASLLEASELDLELLREIEDAMERMREGAYGICLEGGEPIPFERLQAIPWARYCEEHQAAREAAEVRRAAARRQPRGG
jgi:RNA polymerase-binding protein DksA